MSPDVEHRRFAYQRHLELRDLFADVVADHLNALDEMTDRLRRVVKRERDPDVRAVLEQSIVRMRVEWRTIAACAVLGRAFARLR